MLIGFAQIIGLLLIGEALNRGAGLPVPGPVAGLLLFLAVLIMRGGPSPAQEQVSDGLLRHLALFFVPAGVGVIAHGALIAAHGVSMVLALTLGTALVLAGTGLGLQALLRKQDAAPAPDGRPGPQQGDRHV